MDKEIEKKTKAAIAKKTNALQILKIEYVGIDDVEPNEYNPNRQSDHDFDLLKRSITEDGFTQPIIVLLAKNANGKHPIVDGEHRWRAARDLGFTEIPVAKVDMSMEQARISTLRHNRARGSEDIELSAQVLRELRDLGALDWAADSLQLDDIEIERLINEIPAPDALAHEEFSEAWNPEKATDTAFQHDDSRMAHGATTSMTPAAADRTREIERKIATAKTQEEKEGARRDANIYRLVVTFAGEEADDVKAIVEREPNQAIAVLKLCRAQLEKEKNGD
jgi:ParB/RepB/Spo0J family partition protein